MAKLFSRASVTGATLPGANLKATLTALWDALNSKGLSDATSRPTLTTSATLATTQCGLVLVDCSTGSVVLTLPTSGSTTDEAEFQFRRLDSTAANSLTVQRGAADTIEGAVSLIVPPNGSTHLQMPTGANDWKIKALSGSTGQGARNNTSASDSPFRNVVINGGLFEDQRNLGAAQTIVAGAALAYCVDRFYAYCAGANVTGQQTSASNGTKRYQFTGAAAVTAVGFGHRVEAANSVRLAGGIATLSVRLANSVLTTVSWAAYYANTADTFGTLAAPTRTAIASGTFNVSGAEAVYSAQLNVPSAATTGIEIVLSVGAQVSGTWTIGEVQLEKGAVPAAAISFEVVDVGINKVRCQRYLPAFNGATTQDDVAWGGTSSGNVGVVAYPFLVEARAPITGIVVNNVANFSFSSTATATAATAITFTSGGKRMCRMGVTGTGSPYVANQPAVLYGAVVGAQILFTGAEL